MSTSSAEVTPDSESSPEQQVLLAVAPQQESSPKRWRGWIGSVVALVLAALILSLALTFRHVSTSRAIQPFVADSPEIIRLKGTTEAVQSRAILAPLLAGQQIEALTIIHLIPGGTKVSRGDFLVEFDRQAQMRDFVDKQAEYQKLVDQVSEEQAKESAARAKDETELKTAEDTLRKAELEVQKAEIVSKIDGEKNQESLEEAKATYDQLRETFDLKRKAAQAAIRILEIQRDRTKQTMEHAQANATQMQIRSPLDGIVVLNTIWKQGTMGEVQEGDQVRPGVPFMQVVDPAAMQVRILANQEDFPVLQVDQLATIHLDAYPEMIFHGKIDQISPIGENGDFSSKLRNFAVVVSIQGNDPKLMPDLSAAVDILTTAHKAEAASTKASGDL